MYANAEDSHAWIVCQPTRNLWDKRLYGAVTAAHSGHSSAGVQKLAAQTVWQSFEQVQSSQH